MKVHFVSDRVCVPPFDLQEKKKKGWRKKGGILERGCGTHALLSQCLERRRRRRRRRQRQKSDGKGDRREQYMNEIECVIKTNILKCECIRLDKKKDDSSLYE